MTFGQIKSVIENNLLESYKNETEFKKTLKEFKHNILNNKNISKIYSIYDQLSSPQELNESDAKEFLNEGIFLIQKLLSTTKINSSSNKKIVNGYQDIDNLVYTNKTDIHERIESKKNIIKVLTSKKIQKISEAVNIPIKSMVKIANQTLSNYLETLDENAKKEFIQLLSEDVDNLKSKFEILRENTISKLTSILENEKDSEIKDKVTETLERIKKEKFDQINYLRLKTLEESI